MSRLSSLDVLRGIISETTNAAKTSSPVNTDSQMLNTLGKRIKSAQSAVSDYEKAKRMDLRDREAAQIVVMEEYMRGSDILGKEDIAIAVQQVIGDMRTKEKKVDRGSVMKALVGPGGTLDGQSVDRKDVAKTVDEML